MAKSEWDKFLDKAKEYIGKAPTPPTTPVQPAKAVEQPRKFEDTGKDARSAIDAHKKALAEAAKDLPQYKRGGMVQKTGPALVHKGERVLTAKQAKKPAVKKALKSC